VEGAIPRWPRDRLPWLGAAQMAEVDRLMVDEYGITLVRMMENAGRALAELVGATLGGDVAGRPVVLACGPGGNGGRGLVAARHLLTAGADVEVWLAAPPGRLAPVPAEQCEIVRRLGVPLREGRWRRNPRALVVDALLGYSQRGAPRGAVADAIAALDGRADLSLDVPSGLELETGRLHACHVRADATLTLAAPKRGLERAEAGRLYLANISVPPAAYARLGIAYETPFAVGPLLRLT
jgi:NAD(P)H-hydrate epimerase